RPVGESRWAWALLAATIALAGPLLVSRFNIDPHGIGLYICRRFHVLPTLLLAVPVASALDVACARLRRPSAAGALAVVGFVAFVCSELLRRDWYRARWASRGLALPSDPGAPLGAALLRTGRPVLVDRGLTGILAAFPSYPLGVLHRVLPRGTAPPPPHDIAEQNRH